MTSKWKGLTISTETDLYIWCFHYINQNKMKTLFCCFLVFTLTKSFSQTTHQVTVAVNQPAVCTVVSVEKKNGEEISVYPNPAREFIFFNGLQDDTKVQILDHIGRRLSEHSLDSHQNTGINVGPLPRGIYYVRIRNERRSSQSKIILEWCLWEFPSFSFFSVRL